MSKSMAEVASAGVPITPTPPVIGELKSIPPMTQDATSSDGFLCAYLNIDDQHKGNRGSVECVLTEKWESVGVASAHNYPEHDRWVSRAALFVPLLKQTNYYLKVNSTSGSIDSQTKAHWADLKIGQLGAPTPIKVEKNLPAATAPTDGFLLCQATKLRNGDRSVLSVYLDVTDRVIMASCCQHAYDEHDVHYPMESFCVPLQANTKYRIEVWPYTLKGEPVWYATWIPLQGAKLGSSIQNVENVKYVAQSDGFLVGVLQCNDGGRGYCEVHVGTADLSREQLLALPAVAGTSVHEYHEHDTWMMANTVTVPIRRGTSYLIDLKETCPPAGLKAYFVPVNAM